MARNPVTLFTPGAVMAGADPFLSLHREMNRLFDEALHGGTVASGSPAGARSSLMLAPHIDVTETGKDVRIQAELPGVSENDIEVSLNEDVLTIRAEKKQERHEEQQGTHVSERSFGTFQRSLRMPFPVDADQVQARFENGVLSVTLPKTQPQERVRRIQVQGTSPGGSQQGDPQQAGGGGEAAGTQASQQNGSTPASGGAGTPA